jgi:GNAT superfamily N-acetyltransferase
MKVPPTQLVRVATSRHWRAYHQIRREVLFDARGRRGAYDENHPDERLPGHHPLLLLADGQPVGTVRLDDRSNGSGVVRLVAIVSNRQRQGLGSVLMSGLERYAMEHGITRLEASVAPDAVGFYMRLGWSMHDNTRSNPMMVKSLSLASTHRNG